MKATRGGKRDHVPRIAKYKDAFGPSTPEELLSRRVGSRRTRALGIQAE